MIQTDPFFILISLFCVAGIMASAGDDPFDSLLTLEDEFYKDGYNLGVIDGERAGLVEGRLFGLEKGFEKYAALGKLHGRALVWAGRLPCSTEIHDININGQAAVEEKDDQVSTDKVPILPANARLESHIRTLYALTEPGSLSTENTEDSVSDFDDRLRRAEGKVKIIEKLVGEHSELIDVPQDAHGPSARDITYSKRGDDSIENTNILHARH